MKKYIQSLGLFFGSKPLKRLGILMAECIIFMAIIAFCDVFTGTGSDFLSGMLASISAMIGPVAAMIGEMLLILLYNSFSRDVPGYKYFRSIPGSGVQVARGIIAVNVLVFMSGIVLLALSFALLRLINADCSGIIVGVLLLPFVSGICNFTGFLKRSTSRVLILIVILSLTGFVSGITTGISEEGDATISDMFMQNSLPFIVILAAGLVVFAAGLIFSVNYAKKKWGVDKCAD